MGRKVTNNVQVSPLILRRAIKFCSDNSKEGIVLFSKSWDLLYSNSTFEQLLQSPNFQSIYDALLSHFKSAKEISYEKETGLSSLLLESGVIDVAYFNDMTLMLNFIVHDLEEVNAVRFLTVRQNFSVDTKESFYQDRFTGLPNKNYFLSIYSNNRIYNGKSKNEYFLFLISLSNPDSILNKEDNFYYESIALKIADRLKKYISKGDQIFRLGSERFLIATSNIDSELEAEWFAECIILLFSFPFTYREREFHLNANVGYAQFDQLINSDLNSLRILEEAVQQSALIGPNSFYHYDRNTIEQNATRAKIEIDLRKVLNRNELELAYQPILDLRQDSILSMEVLLRWNHPEKGKLMPASFISIAESSSFIKTIGEWLIWDTLKSYSTSILKDNQICISLNISAKQLNDKQIFNVLKEATDFYGISPDSIILEIIEDSFDTNLVKVNKVIGLLKDFGYRFAIDDFGKGYSSLGRLQTLPVDYIKLDKVFLFNYFKSSSKTIISSLINLIQAMDKAIIVEGVENPSQHELLKELNCNYAQGYFYSYPLESSKVEEYVKAKFNQKISRS
ncbi:GGDEF domain-containing protein [Leptospira kmetyi]|uniref:GGDEF domain-containing protein n=1 Tax=Leptospira kmetyi TaxID=408139 RepID=A0A5F1XSP7_9LEPT|nr:GGDEF domain-containing phosphodiesterase [Leptospira kmetyi]AYV57435.1 GGDEF domain-containing protein [Leptospira kmetyi]PJZ31039.1 GGDEF domain-containing protein [Leptospira kmetyi]TGK17116.1 GGDEF domain-containing protein [Leptospira kmetyi]TGK33167.1 GGDEF domain-containing protein [Leptospira kmetyi]